MKTIAALFVETEGTYFGLPGVDPWDKERDARLYDGPHPVVAHPPCSTWCQLAHVNQARYGHKVGSDGGCFEAALRSVLEFGGVLEHPASSYAWPAFGLLRPQRGCWVSDALTHPRAWVCEVAQSAYGHPARKRTWLYYVGPQPPELDWSQPEGTAWVSWMANHGNTSKRRIGKRVAAATPPAFRDVLMGLARRSALD